MPFYRDTVYPRLVELLGDPAPIRALRQKMMPLARGAVLEIGAGSGANFPHYDPAGVTRLYALEPNPGMRRLAARHLGGMQLKVEFLDLPGDHIPLGDGSVDTAVSTFTLCTIPAIREAIGEVRRVLKPGGRLLFIELGLSPDPEVARWQKRLEPFQEWLFQGLRLTCHIPSLLVEGGFQIEQLEQGYLADFPKASTYCWWGTAVPRSEEHT